MKKSNGKSNGTAATIVSTTRARPPAASTCLEFVTALRALQARLGPKGLRDFAAKTQDKDLAKLLRVLSTKTSSAKQWNEMLRVAKVIDTNGRERWRAVGPDLAVCAPDRFVQLLELAEEIVQIGRDPMTVKHRDASARLVAARSVRR
jgi:hypothetical protein